MLENPVFMRIRFQLLGAVLVAVVLPALVGPNVTFWIPGTIPSQDNTIAATAIAVLGGYYFSSKLNQYPGVQAAAYILATFFAAYAAVLFLLLFARLDYSRFQIGVSFVLCIGWFYGLYFLSNRANKPLIAIVPLGKVDGLKKVKSIRWIDLEEPVLNQPVYAIVADLRYDLDNEWQRFVTDCSVSGTPVFHVKQLRESITGQVEIEHISENTFGSLLPNMAYMKFKLFLDILLSLLVLPIILLLMIVFAVLIKLHDGGPVLFSQQRIGYRGKPFLMLKLRTMASGSSDPEIAEDAKTKQSDKRITPVGRWLRRTHLDELPQIFNILKGDMSWIGPRPEASILAETYEAGLAFYRYRHVVRPGITGWAQVNQGHVAELTDVNKKLNYDFYYIKNFSPWLDVLIVLKTLVVMVTGKGAR